jgi:hypothetical protein
MGLSVGPQSFAPITVEGEVVAVDGQPVDGQPVERRSESPLDPLIAALGRAVERSARHEDRQSGRG